MSNKNARTTTRENPLAVAKGLAALAALQPAAQPAADTQPAGDTAQPGPAIGSALGPMDETASPADIAALAVQPAAQPAAQPVGLLAAIAAFTDAERAAMRLALGMDAVTVPAAVVLRPPRAPGRGATFSETATITVLVAHNPKQPGSASAERFALYYSLAVGANGQPRPVTVGMYLDACHALPRSSGSKRHRWNDDIRWDTDAKRGFIEVTEAA